MRGNGSLEIYPVLLFLVNKTEKDHRRAGLSCVVGALPEIRDFPCLSGVGTDKGEASQRPCQKLRKAETRARESPVSP